MGVSFNWMYSKTTSNLSSQWHNPSLPTWQWLAILYNLLATTIMESLDHAYQVLTNQLKSGTKSVYKCSVLPLVCKQGSEGVFTYWAQLYPSVIYTRMLWTYCAVICRLKTEALHPVWPLAKNGLDHRCLLIFNSKGKPGKRVNSSFDVEKLHTVHPTDNEANCAGRQSITLI